MYTERSNLVKFNMEYRNIALDTEQRLLSAAGFPAETEDINDFNKRGTFYVGGDFAIFDRKGAKSRALRPFSQSEPNSMRRDFWTIVVTCAVVSWDGKQIIDEMFSIHEAFKPERWFVETGGAIPEGAGAGNLELEQRSRGVYIESGAQSSPPRTSR